MSHSHHWLLKRLLLLHLLLLLGVVVAESLRLLLHLLASWDESGQRVNVCRVLQVVGEDVIVHREQAEARDPVLNLEQVVSLILHPQKEIFLLLGEEVVLFCGELAAHAALLLQLLLDFSSLSF